MSKALDSILEVGAQTHRITNSSAYESGGQTGRATTSPSSEVLALITRYKDAYHVAEFIVAVGGFFKNAGIVLAALISLGAFIVMGQTRNEQQQLAILVVGLVIAAFVGSVFFLFGLLVAAQGQVLNATLDGAVNTSPFLVNEDRAKMMSLPQAKAISPDDTHVSANSPSVTSSTEGQICRGCGSKLGPTVKFCGVCGSRT